MTRKTLWAVIFCGAAILMLSAGIRQGFGLLLRPISMDLELGRQVFGMSLAIQTLITGIGSPVAGAIADRYGHWRVVGAGALLYALGLLLASLSTDASSLHLTFGVMIGIALSAASMGVMFGAVAPVVAPRNRTIAFGVITSGGSFGQFLIIPFTNAMLGELGWRLTCVWLAGGAVIMLALSFALRASGRAAPLSVESSEARSLSAALVNARAHPSYWLLVASFFVCGFHVSLVATHLPAFFLDRGLPAGITAQAYALIGLFNIFGSILFGWASSRYPKRHVLAGIYVFRALIFIPLLLLPTTPAIALLFSAAMGFVYLGTVPPTSGLVAQFFGLRYLATLFGLVFLSHQVGGFFGSWFAGYMFDVTGSYDLVWTIAIALSIVAALLCLPMKEQPLSRPMSPSAA